VLAAAATPAQAETASIHVAPGGNDNNSGTGEAPVATPAKARQLARTQAAAGNDVPVLLAGGTQWRLG
jgi:hypothetical protein